MNTFELSASDGSPAAGCVASLGPFGHQGGRARNTLVLATFLLSLLALAFSASAAHGASPWWHLSTNVYPATIPAGGEGTIVVEAINLGNASTSGPITLTDLLPEHLKVQEEEVGGRMVPAVKFFAFSRGGDIAAESFFGVPSDQCSLVGQSVTCHSEISSSYFAKAPFDEPPFNEPPVQETIEGLAHTQLDVPPVQPYEDVELRIQVKDEGAASGERNHFQVSGGSQAAASVDRPIPVGEAAPTFGSEAESFAMTPEAEGGEVDTQAGSHPYQLTTTFSLNQTADEDKPPALARNLNFNLPAGLIGNATVLPQCSAAEFAHVNSGGVENECPADTVVGVASVRIFEPSALNPSVTWSVPLFNLIPERGEPARFGFEVLRTPVFLDTSIRTGSDYGITVSVKNITEVTNFMSSTVTFWGVPGDPSHDTARGWSCLAGGHWPTASGESVACQDENQVHPKPFLTMPSSCSQPFAATVEGRSWPTPGHSEGLTFPQQPSTSTDQFGRELGVSGCNQLAFAPTIEDQPDVTSASSASGFATTVRVPQEVSNNPNGLASSSVRDISVKFPEGVAVNPAGADGLAACTQGQVGFTGFKELDPSGEAGARTAQFTPVLPNPLEPGTNFCPDASKIGTVLIKVPVIAHPLEGSMYLATQDVNPFNSLVAAYIVAEDKQSGVLVKLPGEISLDPTTGRLTATFENSPDAPLESAEIHLFGGERAPLSTPARCGSYTTEATFAPWSATAPVTATSQFKITTGPNGAACPGASLPFNPSLAGGATNVNAGAFSPFTATFSRSDGEQSMQSIEAHLPPGLSGILAGVELCPEPQANQGECGPNSLIGETTVSVGVGGDPFTVSGGKFYLTGPYNGTGSCSTPGTNGCAPFGITFEVPAKAGPFDLANTTSNHPACDCVLVRGKIEIDPLTTAITIKSNPPGTPDAIPTSLEGIPLQIKHINATTTRGNFQFNPTNCNKMEVTGTIHSSEGASDAIGVPFQVTNCQALKFEPKFAASTSGKTSKANGASLSLKVTRLSSGPGSGQANFALAKIELPKQLPSRLTTLQKACTAAQFESNPGGCPAASDIGHVKVTTPILPVPLEGPAYFVSHGGEAFPSVIFVLQGYGVTVDVVSTTFISKSGITSATIKTVPDAPFTSFELSFPEKQYSALAANGNLCSDAGKLKMPTEFIAQNGARITQSTPISVTGCSKKKALTRAQKLKGALAACHKDKSKGERQKCEKAARKRYGPLKKAKKRKGK